MSSSSSVPAFTNTCYNCGAALAGAFCSACGQEHRHERLRAGDWLRDVLDAFTTLDSRIWRTVAALTERPGRMAQEYVAGSRAPFVSPLRYALGTCALWWFGVALVNDAAGTEAAWWIEYGQLVNLASVPFLALAMQWPFLASRYNYAETLSFALYTTGHVFLWRAGLALIGFIGDPGNVLDYADSALYFAYTAWALWQFHAGRVGRRALRVLGALFGILVFSTVLAVALAMLAPASTPAT
jgi:hypothetical protein